MIYTSGGRLSALAVVSIAVTFHFVLAESDEEKGFYAEEAPAPPVFRPSPAPPPPAPAPKKKGFSVDLSSIFNSVPTPAPAPAPPRWTPPTPAPEPVVVVGNGGDQPKGKMSKDAIAKIVAGSVGIAAAVGAAGAGIGLAIHQSEMKKHTTTTAAPTTGTPLFRESNAGSNAGDVQFRSNDEGSSMELRAGHGSLKGLTGDFWTSSGDFTWLILLIAILLTCIGCVIGICASTKNKKGKKKQAPRSVVGGPAASAPSHEQAPLLNERGPGVASFPPPAARGTSGYDPMGTRMDVMPTSTMYNGPAAAAAGFGQYGGYYPSSSTPNPVSPLALETSAALAPPPPPPKPHSYQTPPNSFGQPPTYFGGLQTQPPAGPPSFPVPGSPSGRPDMQTMPPGQAFGGQQQSPYGGYAPSGGYAPYAPAPAAPSGYSHTQTMQTMAALPQQPMPGGAYGYR